MIGQRIGNYKISELLGEGGMGSVYLAEHPGIGRRVAVKIVHGEMLEQDPMLASRFFNEARAANAVGHPGIVAVLDHGMLPDGRPYLVMEYLEGESLSTRIRRRAPFPPEEAIEIVLQAASALAAAHVKGIVHRDLKPDNLIIVRDPQDPAHEQVKLLDFGIAKFFNVANVVANAGNISGAGTARRSGHTGNGTTNTVVGALLGTPAYMSPEQCLGARDVDHRSDIYSLGVILYELLCGMPPFVSDKQAELIYFHMSTPPIAPRRRNPSIPERLETLVLKMLSKDPTDRIQTMVDLQRALTGEAPGAQAEPTVRPKRNSRPLTTLASSALPLGAPPPAESRTGRWLGVLLAGTLAASGALGVSLWKRQRPRPVPAPAVAATPAPAPAAPAPAPTVMPLPAPPPPAEPPPVTVNIATEPSGARLVRDNDGEVVGTTPFSAAWPATDGEDRLRIELRGYQTETIVVPRQIGAELDLTLKPLPAPAVARRRKPAPAPARAPAIKRKPRPSFEPVPL